MIPFIFSLIRIAHANDISVEKNFIALPKKQSLSLLPPQWYLIQPSSQNDIQKIKSLLKITKIDSLNIVGNSLILCYLTPHEARLINQIPNITISYKAPQKRSFSSSKTNQTYIVYAHSSFHASKYSSETSNSGPFFFISTNQPNLIESDPSVFSVKPLPVFMALNRWTTGFLQTGDEREHIINGYYMSNRTFHDRGLNGSNIILTLVDTGLDVDNCLFNDPRYPTPFNVTNMNHRKVVRYDAFVDNKDKVFGHGTHCGGILAGSTEVFPMNFYNGHAPGAKLYVADLAKDVPNTPLDTSHIYEVVEQSRKLNSPIISCSYGSSKPDRYSTVIYDTLSYIHKDQLFVFCSGNDGYYYTVNSPGDSKNVLTVGATTAPISAYIAALPFVRITSGDESIRLRATNEIYGVLDKTVSFLNNIELVDFDVNIKEEDYWIYANKAVLANITNTSDTERIIQLLAANHVKAVFHNFYASYVNDILSIHYDNLDDFLFLKRNRVINITLLNENLYKKNTVAAFSSQGPTISGLRKPDVMAPGSDIRSAKPISENSDNCKFESSLVLNSGTSMATPAVAGSMALVYQYLNESIHGLPQDNSKNITSALLRAFAVAAAQSSTANIKEGFGNINLNQILIYPNIDLGRGMRYVSSLIKNKETHSYFIRTDSIGKLIISLAWIDVPLNPESKLPLFSYFDLSLICPDGKIHDVQDPYSTTKKIIIDNAAIGTYEIRIHVNFIFETDDIIDYSLVVVGSFDHLNFNNNPSEMKHKVITACSSKCPVDKGYAKCNSQTSTCICDKLHTGPNCEYEIANFNDSETLNRTFNEDDFFYAHFDLSKYKNDLKKGKLSDLTLDLQINGELLNGNQGMIRFFINTDNELPLSIPRHSNEFMMTRRFLQYNFTTSFPISIMNAENDDIYLTVYNYLWNQNFAFSWKLGKELTVNKYGNENSEDKPTQFTKTKTLKIIILCIITVGCASLIACIILLTVKSVNKKKRNNNNNQNYTDGYLMYNNLH